MTIEFNERVIVITGATSGIGLATANLMYQAGGTIIMLDTNPEGEHHARRMGADVVFLQVDVSDEIGISNCFDRIKSRFGGIDVLVNNAGIQTYGSVTEMAQQEWDRTLSVNLKGIYLVSKYAIPMMLSREAPVIVNVASVKSFLSDKGESAYVASKAGVLGLTQSIAVDYAPSLRCVAVCPGAVNTPMLQVELEASPDPERVLQETKNIHLLKRIAEPVEVAHLILFLSSRYASFITGHAYRVDGGIGVKLGGI